MLPRGLLQIMLLYTLAFVVLAQIAAPTDAIPSPRPRIDSLIHRIWHKLDAPCNRPGLLTLNSVGLNDYEHSIQKAIMKRLDNSTTPVVQQTSSSIPSSSSSSTTPLSSSSTLSATTMTTSSTTSPTSSSVTSSSVTSSSAAAFVNPIEPSASSGRLANPSTGITDTTTSSSSSIVLPPSVTSMLTSTSSQVVLGTSTSTVSSPAGASVRPAAASSGTKYTVSPSGIVATPTTSTELVVVQGTGGPMTETSAVVIWLIPTSTSTSAVTTEVALQSDAISFQYDKAGLRSLTATLCIISASTFLLIL